MGVDHIIDYACEPKQALTLEGLIGRLKGRDRAAAIIQLYRDQGDHRSPAQMGFEMVRRLSDGSEEVEMIVVQQLLDAAEELHPWEAHCVQCPANRGGQAFGCVAGIPYPISAQAERWLLDQLPGNDHPLPYMLLQRAVREMGYTGENAASLRAQTGIFFESPEALTRDLAAMQVSGDQVFELLFLSGHIRPAHGTMLLQFFGGISQDLDADTIMQLPVPPSPEWIDETVPFRHLIERNDDPSVEALKGFFHAIYVAYRLGNPLLLDV